MVHFGRLSDGKSGFSHSPVFRYYHIKDQDQVGGVDVNEFAREHNLLKFTFVRHPFGR